MAAQEVPVLRSLSYLPPRPQLLRKSCSPLVEHLIKADRVLYLSGVRPARYRIEEADNGLRVNKLLTFVFVFDYFYFYLFRMDGPRKTCISELRRATKGQSGSRSRQSLSGTGTEIDDIYHVVKLPIS